MNPTFRSTASVRAAVRAEFTKTLTLPWTTALLALVVALGVVPALLARMTVSTGSLDTATRLPDIFGLTLGVLVCMILGCLVAGSDFRSGELNMELIAMPYRYLLATAKIIAICSIVAVAIFVAYFSDRIIRLWTDPELVTSTADSPASWQVFIGLICTGVTFTAIGFVLATALRNSMIAAAVLLLMPIFFVQLMERVCPIVAALLPFSASKVVVAGQVVIPMSWWTGMLILFVWWTIASAAYLLLLRYRDA